MPAGTIWQINMASSLSDCKITHSAGFLSIFNEEKCILLVGRNQWAYSIGRIQLGVFNWAYSIRPYNGIMGECKRVNVISAY